MRNAAKNFNILVTSLIFYIIILIVQQNYFSDPYPAKILDFSAKPSFREYFHYFYILHNDF